VAAMKVRGGYQPEGDVERPQPPKTGSGVQRRPPPPRDPLPPPLPTRTPEQAMREFEYACRVWFACMPIPEDRNAALQRAIEIANEIPFEPNRPPRAA
jgi:hypothetical protein